MIKIPVSEVHPDHYIELEAAAGGVSVWRCGFTGLKVVLHELDSGISWAVNGRVLVSVIDRHSEQTWAWALNLDTGSSYVRDKIPHKTFNKVWRDRMGESVAAMLRLHRTALHATGAADDPS